MTGTHLHVETITDHVAWNSALHVFPQAHILQSWEWAEFKQVTTGWEPERFAFRQGGNIRAMASVLTRRIGPLAVMYVPKGPVLDANDTPLFLSVVAHLQQMARSRRAIWLKIDPDIIAATGVPNDPDDTPDPNGQAVIRLLSASGWRYSADQVQFRNTITIDLTASEDELLATMSQNTRRKVRTAEKKGVTIRTATLNDLNVLYDLYRATGERDEFLIRPPAYYERAWRDFMQAGLAHVLIAEAKGEPIAHVILFHFGRTCWYFYGASSNAQREKMPNYLLQWEAMRWAKAQGYHIYDMWGAPNDFVESDSMWGVYQFKRGFRGTVTRHIGAWDYTPHPVLYRLYTGLWPRMLAFMRHH